MPNWQVFVKKKRDAFFPSSTQKHRWEQKRKIYNLIGRGGATTHFRLAWTEKNTLPYVQQKHRALSKKAVKNRLLCLVSESQNFSEEKMSVSCKCRFVSLEVCAKLTSCLIFLRDKSIGKSPQNILHVYYIANLNFWISVDFEFWSKEIWIFIQKMNNFN